MVGMARENTNDMRRTTETEIKQLELLAICLLSRCYCWSVISLHVCNSEAEDQLRCGAQRHAVSLLSLPSSPSSPSSPPSHPSHPVPVPCPPLITNHTNNNRKTTITTRTKHETAKLDRGIEQNSSMYGTLRANPGSARIMYETVCRHIACQYAGILLAVLRRT